MAINETTARRIGVSIASLDFKYHDQYGQRRNAGGMVRLQRVEVGQVRVDDVDAFVLRDKALSGTLIGMSFLKRLSAYSAEGDRLRLEHRRRHPSGDALADGRAPHRRVHVDTEACGHHLGRAVARILVIGMDGGDDITLRDCRAERQQAGEADAVVDGVRRALAPAAERHDTQAGPRVSADAR